MVTRFKSRPLPRSVELNVNVGILVNGEGAGAQAGTDHGDGLTVAQLATIHEFGLGVPQRSFIRAWFDTKGREAMGAIAAARMQAAIEAGGTPKDFSRAAQQIGIRARSQMVAFIDNQGVYQNLSPETIRRKKSSKALIDTGVLKGAIGSNGSVTSK